MLADFRVIRSESYSPIDTPILLEGGLVLFKGGDRSQGEWERSGHTDITIFQAANIWGKLFLNQGSLYWIHILFIKH